MQMLGAEQIEHLAAEIARIGREADIPDTLSLIRVEMTLTTPPAHDPHEAAGALMAAAVGMLQSFGLPEAQAVAVVRDLYINPIPSAVAQ
jgi:hypothetical protein